MVTSRIREGEVLQLVAEGNSSKDIANLLNLSVYAVRKGVIS